MSLIFADGKALRRIFLHSQNEFFSKKTGSVNAISMAYIEREIGIRARGEIYRFSSEIIPIIQQLALKDVHSNYTVARRYTCRV